MRANPHRSSGQRGVTAAELASRQRVAPTALSADAIGRWLVERGLATERDGRLSPIELAVELRGGLTDG